MKKRICIGILAYSGVSAEVLEDYMRFAFYLGRHYQEHDFFLAIKTKTEQFRARNYIVEAALTAGCTHLLMLDDDNLINWNGEFTFTPNGKQAAYEFLNKMLEPFENDLNVGIVGALYYQRDPMYYPVVLKMAPNGDYSYLKDEEITGGLQEVDVTGGGCMLINMNLFDKIDQPWFTPEHEYGTDMQICKQAKNAGYKVFCDTSIVLGHVRTTREVISPLNRTKMLARAKETLQDPYAAEEDANEQLDMEIEMALQLYTQDAQEYLNLSSPDDFNRLAKEYHEGMISFGDYENKEDYYRNLGAKQIGRQVWYHHDPRIKAQFASILNMLDHRLQLYLLDFGCGSAPVGMQLSMLGHKVDFIDIDGAPAYEFLKWRAKKRNLNGNAGFEWGGPYDAALLLDSLEHVPNWQEILGKIIESVKPRGAIITNYFMNQDIYNPEHISMDKPAVASFLKEHGMFPVNETIWMKHNPGKEKMK